MKQARFTNDELMELSSVLEDITIGSEEAGTGGMYTGIVYITPEQCYHMANILKKLNEYLYEKPTIYKRAYNRYRRYQNSK